MESRQSRVNRNSNKRNRNSNKPYKKKRHGLRNFLIVIFILAIVAFAGFSYAKSVIKQKTETLANEATTAITSVAVAGKTNADGSTTAASIAPANPTQIAQKLNEYSSVLASKSQGFIDSGSATVNGSTLTYTAKSSKLNSTMANAMLAASGYQVKQVADQVLDSMAKSGTANPKVVFNLTDANGNTIKTITYSK